MSVLKNILETKIPIIKKTKQNRLMLLSNCAACCKKKIALYKK